MVGFIVWQHFSEPPPPSWSSAQLRNKCSYTAPELSSLSLLLSADFFVVVMIPSRTAELLIQVTGVISKIWEADPKLPVNTVPIVIVTEGCFWGDLWWHSPPSSDTGNAELCIQMTGMVAMSHNIFAPTPSPRKPLSSSNESHSGGWSKSCPRNICTNHSHYHRGGSYVQL